MGEIKLFIGLCNSQTTVPSAFFWSWERMEKPYSYRAVRFSDGDAILRNNHMVRDFLKSGCDILVKMDIDQVYPNNYLTTMVPLVEKYNVIGPLIYVKWRSAGYAPLLCEEDIFPMVRPLTNWFERAGKDGILKIPYAHTNLFYSRKSLTGIDPPWYEVKYKDGDCAHSINRDFSFIDKVRKNGYETYINMNVEVGHLVEEVVNSETNYIWSGRKK